MNPIRSHCATAAHHNPQRTAAYRSDEDKMPSPVQQGYAAAVCRDQVYAKETEFGIEGEHIDPIQPQIAMPLAPGTSVF